MNMEDLSTAYDAIEILENLGLYISSEQLQNLKRLEQQYINEVIVPHIKDECEPLLEDLVEGCHLILTYSKEKGLDIVPYTESVRTSSTVTAISQKYPNQTIVHDLTKYSFNHSAPLTKRRCVLAVVTQYAKDHPDITFEELEEQFPAYLIRPYLSYGVVRRYDDVRVKYDSLEEMKRRYYAEEDEVITLMDGTRVVVCTQWGAEQFKNFHKHVSSIYPNIVACY